MQCITPLAFIILCILGKYGGANCFTFINEYSYTRH